MKVSIPRALRRRDKSAIKSMGYHLFFFFLKEQSKNSKSIKKPISKNSQCCFCHKLIIRTADDSQCFDFEFRRISLALEFTYDVI